MSFLRATNPSVLPLDIFKTFPATARTLIRYHEVLMRGESPEKHESL
jgi:hypothetical protein